MEDNLLQQEIRHKARPSLLSIRVSAVNRNRTMTEIQIAIVGCGKSKVELEDGEQVQAKELYDSSYFSLKREYAEAVCDEWAIASAEYGLISPNRLVETYDASLSPRHDSYIGDGPAQQWTEQVTESLDQYASVFAEEEATAVVLAGEDYATHLEAGLEAFDDVWYPFRQDELGGFGDQMGWLRDEIDVHTTNSDA